ncbi:MAG: hypothetical protein Q9222_000376 [Ikaeria aurantiellina]
MPFEKRDPVFGVATTQSLQAHFCPLPVTNWTRRAYHACEYRAGAVLSNTYLSAAIVVGDYLYIDGGEIALGQEPYPTNGSVPNATYDPYIVSLELQRRPAELLKTDLLFSVNVTLSLPLGESWTPDKARFNVIIKPSMPLWNFQSLWHDPTDDSVWAFGGEISLLASSSPDLSIWNMKPNGGGGGTWTQKSNFRGAPWNQNITRPLGGAGVASNHTGFLLGGYSSARSSPFTQDLVDFVPTPGLLTYSFDNGTWANVTDTSYISDSGAIEWPGMEFVPFGPNGLMLVIGGETSGLASYAPGNQERSMTQITLFDPITLQFYQQTASGDKIPSQRNRFCIAGVGDQTKIADGSLSGSYEIYIYGGYGGNLGAGAEQYDEIWVLTLPAFEWVQVDAPHGYGRIGHTCHVVGNSQLLSIGGADAAQSDPWSTVDPAFQGLGTFDLNGWNWTQSYNANAAPYRRAAALRNFYDINGPYPKTWDMPELRDLIIRNTTDSSQTTSSSALPTSTANSDVASSPRLTKYEKIGISVGATIGGLVLLILGAILFICFRRRRQRVHDHLGLRHPKYSNELPGHSNKHELPPGPRIHNHTKPSPRRFLVELDAGEVAAEKGIGNATPGGGRLPVMQSHNSMAKPGYGFSTTSSEAEGSMSPQFVGMMDGSPPTPPKDDGCDERMLPPRLMISPPSMRRKAGL